MLYSPNLCEAFLNLQESVMDNPTEDIIDSDTIDIATSEIISNWKWQSGEESFRNAQESPQCTSPESSFDAKCPSPEMSLRAFIDLPYWIQGQKPSKLKMSTQRRSKASEREKMRMRSLATALHELRDYLPVGYSQRGQPLTKIQTLKDTIKYINELSEILKKA